MSPQGKKNILALVAEGYNNNEIGKKRFSFHETLLEHIEIIYLRKLEISSIRELIQLRIILFKLIKLAIISTKILTKFKE